MLVLIGCSGFFSCSETALFNLTRRQVTQLRKSPHRLEKLAARLLLHPKKLLGCILLGNMGVNVLFFAIASIFLVKLESQFNPVIAALGAFVSFSLLLLFGEVLPKSLAYINSMYLSIAAALPLYICLKVFNPIIVIFRFLIIDPALKLVLGTGKAVKKVSPIEFKSLIEASRQRGLISSQENKLLSEIVELGFLRVRDCLKPRVDMTICSVHDSPESVKRLMLKKGLTKIPVYVRHIDNIVGLIHLRQILLRPDTSVDKLVEPVHFVPEQKKIESLLEFFRQNQTDIAVVVDEFGGIAGSIRLEDIVEELLGPIEAGERIEPVEKLGPFTFRMAGDLTVHDWAETFGIDPEENRISTIGGLVTMLLGKVPQPGDIASLGNLKFTVERVQKRRVISVILTFEPIHYAK
ncbi:MAG: hemolysin family protein [Phycisphaerae bacterium]|nr:hemolysin family protein [Phycisphaerae bacterium]